MTRPSLLRRVRRRVLSSVGVGGRRRLASSSPAVGDGKMTRHEFLRQLHELLEPRTYLEIGVNDGRSLALSRATTVAVDPAFRVTVPLRCNLDLVKATSDEFFAGADPLAHFRSAPLGSATTPDGGLGAPTGQDSPVVDLAFIDGMHLFEFALRDFMNTERHARWWSVIVLDDMLPRSAAEASRERHTSDWTGDVFKVVPVLREHRPDLIVIPVDTSPTGVLVVLGADPRNGVLWDRYEAIAARWVTTDPQSVPASILEREGAVDPASLLGSEVWHELVAARGGSSSTDEGQALVRERLATVTRR